MTGAWLFRNRGWLPVPVALAMLGVPPANWGVALAFVVLGEAVRVWAVGHIGPASRTRGEGVGPLVESGPYACVRNPLYVGNLLLWTGLGILAWPSGLVTTPLFAAYYMVIVRWEEEVLDHALGEPYRLYRARVPRWIPRRLPTSGGWDANRALRSERTTFAVVTLLLVTFGARAALG